MILAGDIGGTNTRLAIFDGDPRTPVALETYPSAAHGGLPEMVEEFLASHAVEVTHASFGVAGPVRAGRTDAVNLAWPVDAGELARLLGLDRVGLINDLEANAWGIASLEPDDVAVLNEGTAVEGGNLAVVSAGTGLGEALVVRAGGRTQVIASEGGHVDFAPRGELQRELLAFLAAEYGHVSYERVCSGMGLANIYRFLTGRREEPAEISEAALAGVDADASRALDVMVDVFGAQAGNYALTVLASGGVYLGGGIAPRILPRLQEGGFLRAFVDKGRFEGLLRAYPVRVILNDRTALLGAALHAAR